MLLTPTELERLTIFSAAELARKRRAKRAQAQSSRSRRDHHRRNPRRRARGRSVADLMSFGSTILTTGDVMPGVVAMLPILQVEGVFPDGTKLVPPYTSRSGPRPAPPLIRSSPAKSSLPTARSSSPPADREPRSRSSTPATDRFRSVRTTISSKRTRRWISIALQRSACASIFPQARRSASNRASARR